MKPKSAFKTGKNRRLESQCRDCRNAWRREYRRTNPETYQTEYWMDNLVRACKRMGITTSDYFRMYEEQGGRCAICERPLKVGAGKGKSAAIDHDHETGKVRGLLCSQCNTALGLLQENLDTFWAAISYLLKHSEPTSPGTDSVADPAVTKRK